MMTNWKTSLSGLAVAALSLYANGATPKQIAVSVAIAFFGLLSKDHDVTGGTKVQPSPAVP